MICPIPKIKYLDSGNFFLIAGPCVVENETMPGEIAIKIKRLQISSISLSFLKHHIKKQTGQNPILLPVSVMKKV